MPAAKTARTVVKAWITRKGPRSPWISHVSLSGQPAKHRATGTMNEEAAIGFNRLHLGAVLAARPEATPPPTTEQPLLLPHP
jgi:hypothetical protein